MRLLSFTYDNWVEPIRKKPQSGEGVSGNATPTKSNIGSVDKPNSKENEPIETIEPEAEKFIGNNANPDVIIQEKS